MKKLLFSLFLLCSLLCAQSAFGATGYVQSVNCADTFNPTTTLTCQFSTQNVTAGNLIAGFVWWTIEGSNSISSVTDDAGNSYTVVTSSKGTGVATNIQGFYAKNIAGGTKPTLTITFAAATTNKGTAPFEISGSDLTSPLDGQVGTNVGTVGGGTNTIASGNWTTSTNGSLILGGAMSGGFSGTTDTAGTTSETYTLRENRNANSESFYTETAVQTSASSSTVIAFSPSGFTGDVILSGMAFKPAGAGATDDRHQGASMGVGR